MITKIGIGNVGSEVVIDVISDRAYLTLRPDGGRAASVSVAASADDIRQIGEAALAVARVLEARERKAAAKS
jgi:hypothetical protein